MSKISESKFLQLLEQKAGEERRLLETEIIPSWARGVGNWLVVNPWRVIVPMAGISYIVYRILLGDMGREFVLGLFGGFR